MEIDINTLREKLAGRIGKQDIQDIAKEIETKGIETLYSLLFDTDKRVGDNAAWVLTHIHISRRKNLENHHDEIIDEVLHTTSVTKQRLLMRLLDDQEFNANEIRADFLDFCLESIVDNERSCGIRSLSIKLALKQCIHYPELLSELRETLELLDPDTLSAGLNHTRKKGLSSVTSDQ